MQQILNLSLSDPIIFTVWECSVEFEGKNQEYFECAHGLKVCAECYFDFSVVNELAKLKYSGQDITNDSFFVVDQVNQTYYSSIELEDCESLEGLEDYFSSAEGFPLECYGMNHHVKQRYILKALMETKVDEISLLAAVAKAAFVTYGGLKYPVLRPNKNLETVAKML